ncbi:dehydrogenase [Pseudoflavitalea sp. X16]|uniref:PVC-type heme-binding CxxCH protein n=1 Tax=Paraflavitalea devenefica TaxID=2716334 RepID=UPI00142245B0|nr:PVC-type heme-binding CxxCH protein [Paraflavitalea devenefica]NII28459.1 dehydrogenase [Paraflavitalea devenefica]
MTRIKSACQMPSATWSIRCLYLFLFFACSAVTGCKNNATYPGPLPPDQAVQSLSIVPGLKIELFAAEPHVADPVAMEFDEDGNCYVVLMSDYPEQPEPGKERGQIRVLRDTDGDGRIDTSIVFADKLSEGTSILPWKGGLLVTAAPEILYMKDTTGDFVADTHEVLFSGFFRDNPEAQITNLRFGADNWIYANNRGQEGNITFKDNPAAPPLSVKGADFRFRLDRHLFEPETGPGQFGQALDDDGNRFVTENSIHIQQTLIPWRYTHRHPYLPTVRSIRNISDHDPIMHQQSATPYWRAERTKRRNAEFQASKLARVEYERDHFTGASGGTYYNGDGLPAPFYGNVFTGEVAGNLVHRDVLTRPADSIFFTARRAPGEEKREFIFSTDTWFRPVNFCSAPDGYLYLLDFYRQHIETPSAIPDDLKAGMDFYNGSDKGRIYRIMPAGSRYKKPSFQLSKMSGDSLVPLFAHPNQWYALQAHRLLVERQDKSVIPAIKKMFRQAGDARARLHALYVLEALDALDISIVQQALTDSSANVQAHGLVLAEHYPACAPVMIALIKKGSAQVVLQAVLSLGQFNNQSVRDAFVQALSRYGYHKPVQMAVLSAEAGSTSYMLETLLANNISDTTKFANTFVQDLSYCIGARNDQAQVNHFLTLLTHPPLPLNNRLAVAITGFMNGIEKSTNASPALIKSIKDLRTGLHNITNQTVAELNKIFTTIH